MRKLAAATLPRSTTSTTTRATPHRRAAAGKRLPILVERGEDGWYVAECPVLPGCYTQGRTLDEALRNIREVIALVLEEKQARDILKDYRPVEIGLHTITV